MIFDPYVLLVLSLLGLLGFVVILFVPSLSEFKRPRDKGPRRVLRRTLHKLNVWADERALGVDLLKISGDVSFPPGFELEEDVVVEGSLTVGDRCHFHRCVKAKGDVDVGSDVVIGGNLVAGGSVYTEDGTVIGGSIEARDNVKLGERVFVRLSVVSGGNVELFENSEVEKNILAQGVIRVIKHPRLEFLSAMEDIG